MRKLFSIAVAIAAVLYSSTSYAGVVVTYLGTSATTVATNALTSGGDLVTSSTGVPDLGAFNSNFVGSVSGLYDAYLVSVNAGGFPPVHFAQNVLGIIASNAFGDGTNPLPRDLVAEFEAATLISTGITGSNDVAVNILGIDSLNVSGDTISGNGVVSFIAIVAVPEPSSLAICLVGAIGTAVAGRRRLREKSA